MALVLVPDTKRETPGRRPALRPEPGFRSRLGWASRDILDTVTDDGLAHQGYPWKLKGSQGRTWLLARGLRREPGSWRGILRCGHCRRQTWNMRPGRHLTLSSPAMSTFGEQAEKFAL